MTCLIGAMHGVAVRLHDHAVIRPHEVSPDRRLPVAKVDPFVDSRIGDARLAADAEESLLELILCRSRPDVVLGQNHANGPATAVVGVAVQLALDSPKVERLHDLRLVEGPLKGPAWNDRG